MEMNITALYFSPTEGTKKAVECLLTCFDDVEKKTLVDNTLPKQREIIHEFKNEDFSEDIIDFIAERDEDFMEVYFEDKQNELKERTMKNKRYMMEQHIVPYFGNQMMSEITAGQIIQWQNEMQTKGFSEAYLRMIQNQLTSLYTHASKIYDFHANPCKKLKRMGSSENRSLEYWTIDEYQKLFNFTEIIPVSARKKDNVDRLIEVLKKYLPDF